MEELQIKVQKYIMSKAINFTDPGYYLLKKMDTHTAEEEEFIDAYEKTYILSLSSLLLMVPSGAYMYKIWQKVRVKAPATELRGVGRKFFVNFLVATVCTVNGLYISNKYNINQRMKDYEEKF
jgi:uncharacterized membrane protein YeiB